MKHALLGIFAFLFCFTPEITAHNYDEGDILTVFANSGLRLRMAPAPDAKTLKIMRLGDIVMVVNTHDFAEDYEDRVGWMDGHWIEVQYQGVNGYVFDAFLSTMQIPDHESELCIDCEHIIHPFENFLRSKYPSVSMSTGPQHSESTTQFISKMEDGIVTTRTTNETWYHLEVKFSEKRLCEVLNLFRAVIPEQQLRKDFDASLIFRQNSVGEIDYVMSRLYDSPIKIRRNSDGTVVVETTVFFTEDGC